MILTVAFACKWASQSLIRTTTGACNVRVLRYGSIHHSLLFIHIYSLYISQLQPK